ncbi:methyltransferase domain-containing protein [Cohnella rhizosphaerae]|uniref:Methyltransferase domain-containing protein n=1 Tax=Cohnella rhizosphaerae TaxID=1457232 RepID=A0A9X4KTJ6_9BACL|nr:methyltransferase domain-containing protein [Cohnella rhizosphaerae]MDG0810829.1 methyltransferase domain-containing protein [Cohnella rhizosphaerae]
MNGKLKNTLNARTLADSFPRLAQRLRPGLRVLDVGCGTGAITRGIADAVGPQGWVVGVDSNAALIAEARARHEGTLGLSFDVADVYSLATDRRFDIVAASRLLVWLSDPGLAMASLAGAARPGGTVLVADYNHDRIEWRPEPPDSMKKFYAAYLKWRADKGLDNAVAERLSALMEAVGLRYVRVFPQHEEMHRRQADFEARASIWADTAASRGAPDGKGRVWHPGSVGTGGIRVQTMDGRGSDLDQYVYAGGGRRQTRINAAEQVKRLRRALSECFGL